MRSPSVNGWSTRWMVASRGATGKPVRCGSAYTDMVFPLVLRLWGALGLQETAPVDDEARPGHEVCLREIKDRLCDIVRGSDPPEQRLRRTPLLLPRPARDRPRRHPQTRTSGASARANTRVSMDWAAFAAQ